MQSGMPVYEKQEGYADTWDIGGSRWSLWSSSAFDPDAYVGTTQVVNMALLSAPPTYSQLGGSFANAGTSPEAQMASAAPFNPKASPTPWVIVGLAVALFGLHWLYYKDRRK